MNDQKQQEQHTGHKAPSNAEKFPPLALVMARMEQIVPDYSKPFRDTISDILNRALYGNADDMARARAHLRRTNPITDTATGSGNKRRPKRQNKRLSRWGRIIRDHLPKGLTQEAIAQLEDVSLETIKADYRDMRADGVLYREKPTPKPTP